MSEIPFVNRLGDALDAATAAECGARPANRRRRPRRWLAVAAAAALCAGSGVAVAELLSDPTEQAVTGVSCYESSALDGGVSVVWPGDRSPAEACATALDAGPADALVACAGKEGVVVFPGEGTMACRQAGLRPLSPQYATELGRVRELERALIALEDSADCMAPAEFAERVQGVLDRQGWTGWRPWLREDLADGPCGTVSERGGNGRRTIAGALFADNLRVIVVPGPARSTDELLFGPDARATALMRESTERCHSQESLHALVRERLEGTGRRVGFTTSAPEDGVTVEEPAGSRLAAGCALIVAVSPAEDGVSIDVQVWQRG